LNISLRDSIGQNIQSVTVGSFGYTRLLSYGSVKAGGGSLLYAGEFNTENGPWVTAEDVRKFSGLLRYSQGTATDGISATAMAYANSWNASDQIALRAITTGQVGLFGEIDPTDGGDQPFHAVDQICKLRRLRNVESKCLCCQIHAQSLQQLHLVHYQPDPRRSIPSIR
jgi:hypothetical protein